MFDIKAIRDEPEAFDAGLAKRGLDPQAAHLIALDETRRKVIAELQELQAGSNAAAKLIGGLMKEGRKDEAEAKKAEVAANKARMQELEAAEREATGALDTALSAIPNIPLDEVPEGPDESANVERHKVGEPRALNFEAKEHFDLGEALGLMDFETAAKLSGSRFVVLKGALARMERAIANFMVDLHTTEFGYEEVLPPYLVRDQAMFGTAQLPKFADDQFAVYKGQSSEEEDRYWLVPTAEVPLTNLVRESILSEEELPRRFTAYTPCFRAEAGAAGRDTRGMIRQHQFSKVELVSVTTPQASLDEHERMLSCAEEVLKRLDLPYRVMTLCTGDMGFSSRRTYDIEVWLPGQKMYREISSCSVCGDFQARRMNARYRPAGEKGTAFVHTLNGSGLAVGRTLVAVLENYQQADGSIAVPDVLQPYMGGKTVIGA
ncbi:seryl-tRNA synthetase [Parvibaculum indicum]|uniref:serine--tRNA ligase n=1 Tax=Parvibaculum indicum TaxID=562969 RepID=UPI001420D255|nr:serine--tRNA ligase [Parvibaculum indicum]NIJ39835.1 seryl-tRNA synthetase [Parvibaculum indicum]